MHCGLTRPVGIPTVFQKPLTVPCTALIANNLPADKTVKGECEAVYRCALLQPTSNWRLADITPHILEEELPIWHQSRTVMWILYGFNLLWLSEAVKCLSVSIE